MGKGVNKVTIIGNLGRDPEIRHGQSGIAICNLNVAVGERKKSGDQWVDHTEWVRVTCFGKTAESVGQYLSKGSQLCVEGRMQTTKYTDKDGNDKWSTEVVAHDVTFLGGKGSPREDGRKVHGGGSSKNADPDPGLGNDKNAGFYDDDLPF